MKIVHLSASKEGGAGIGMMRIHRALLAVGLDTRVLYGVGGPPQSGTELQIPPHADSLGMRLLRKLGMNPSRASRAEAAVDGVDRHIEQFSHPFSRFKLEGHPWIQEADVINLHWVSGFLDYPRFFKSVGKPIVWTLHDQNPYLGGFHYEWERDRYPELSGLEHDFLEVKKEALKGRPVHVVGNSRWNTARAEASVFFASGSTFQTIYYPLDAGEYYPTRKEVAREALGVNPTAKIIGFACHNLRTKRKGLDFLIGLLPRLRERIGQSLQLLSFGQAPEPETISQVGIEWKHLGPLSGPDFQRLAYSAMDIFLVPSQAEAFGQTAIEALACGSAVIASNVGGLREAMAGIEAGILCRDNDRDDWMHAIVRLLNQTEPHTVFTPSALSWIARRHSVAEIAGQWNAIYEKAIR